MTMIRVVSVVLSMVLTLSCVAAQSQFGQLSRMKFPTSTASFSRIAAADIDFDGDIDLAISTHATKPGPVRLLQNDGYGNFTDVSSTHLPAMSIRSSWDLEFARLDLDPWPDLIVTGNGPSILLINTRIGGKFKLAPAGNLAPTTGNCYGVEAVDVDRDQDLDLVFAMQGGGHELHLNNRLGKFTKVATSSMPRTSGGVWDVQLADVDGDGDRDALWGVTGGRSVLYLNNGKGVFTNASTKIPQSSHSIREVLFGDFDGDKDQDVFLCDFGRQDRVWINDGKGNFKDETSTRVPNVAFGSYGGTVADIDEDGDLDVIVGNWTSNATQRIALYVNDGKGKFSYAPSRMPNRNDAALDIVAADLDRDGDLDLGYAWWNGQSGVYFNRAGHLYADKAPAVGATWNFDVYAQPGYATRAQTGVVFLGVGALKARVNTPWGAFGILPPLFVGPGFSIAPRGGMARIQLPIPNNTKLRGVKLWWQGLHNNVPIDVRLTNVWSDTIQ